MSRRTLVRVRQASLVPLLCLGAVALGPSCTAAQAARPAQDCPGITAVGDRMSVRTFSRPFVSCSSARRLMLRTFQTMPPDARYRRVSGWRCAWRTDDFGGTMADCSRAGRMVMAWNDEYGE